VPQGQDNEDVNNSESFAKAVDAVSVAGKEQAEPQTEEFNWKEQTQTFASLVKY